MGRVKKSIAVQSRLLDEKRLAQKVKQSKEAKAKNEYLEDFGGRYTIYK